ncbi:MAG: TraU family protein [Syntrophorhabdaceae bacterium]|nr:TraU family protein [Syntrophorhabdaceae bacterium]
MQSAKRPFAKVAVLLLLSWVIVLGAVQGAHALCRGSFFNPITDVCWQCIFPVTMGGVALINSDIDTVDDRISSPVCLCGTTLGISASFWEPARIVETVKDPYCFNLIGAELGDGGGGFLGGGYREDEKAKSVFSQVHYYLFNVWSLLDLFVDMPCIDAEGFDVAYLTEIDPSWNDDLLAFLINPEAILFGNPVLQMACMADSVAANTSTPIDLLFWCMGSWGSSYPLTGNKTNDTYIQDNAAIAGKFLYKMTRELLLWDYGTNVCGPVIWPVWTKNNFRMHIMKPVRDFTCHPIGRSGLIWSSMKNPSPVPGNDNFNWVMFRRKLCCIGWSP